MPTRRSNGRYYIKRKVPGIGDVYRSLRTDRKGLARKREDMLLALAAQGRQEVVRAWLDHDLTLPELQEAYETGSVHELARSVRRGDAKLRQACRAALRDKAPDVKASTLARYETGLDHFRGFCGEDASVRDSLTTDLIQAFKAHRLDEDDVAKETVNNDLGAVSILCTYANRQGWIDDRPEIKKFSSKVRITYLASDQLAAYMAALRRPFRPLFQLLVGTGMRLGEAEGLKVSNLRIGNAEARALIEDAKTDSGIRAVFIPPWAVEALEAHLEEHGRGGQHFIFDIPRRTVQKEHNRACGIVGIHDYTIHDHRHTAAVHLARAGMPLHLLQQQLGHKNIDQTMRYARFHPDYGDVEEYFQRAGRELGLGTVSAPEPGNSSGNRLRERASRWGSEEVRNSL